MSASHGGARKGAGRKKGAASAKTRKIADKAADEGLTPLEYLLGVMRNEETPAPVRLDAAKAAAPFIHPRLSAVAMSAEVTLSHETALDDLE